MTGKIFRSTFLVGILTFLVCVGLFLGMLYQYFENRVYTELQSEANFVAHGVMAVGDDYFIGLDTSNRITRVAPDGAVIYDSVGDPAAMENHGDREEIKEALAGGEGKASHYSEIFMEKTLYYASRLDDGTVVRVSCTQNSVFTLLLAMTTPICCLLLLVLAMSGFVAFRVTKKITGTIDGINLDRPEMPEGYNELEPLVMRLREQNYTIRRQMEELSRKQREFTAITENMNEGFILVDNRANLLSYNSSALHILNAAPTGEGVSVLQLNRTAKFRETVSRALTGERSEAMLSINDRSYQVIANPVTAAGQVTGAVLVILDVTEKEQRDELRREFTANVSHELKTPLTSISGFAELIKSGLVEPGRIKEFAGDIYDESVRLINLVEDIIKLSKLDEEDFTPEREEVDIYSLAKSVAARLAPAAEKMDVAVTVNGESTSVLGVAQILDEMIYNLVENAIKYNKPGGSVTVAVEDGKISVSDTGIGIDEAHRARVFERFYRVDKSHSREIGGTGLGLSIVKHGAKFHDALVELQSEPGKGTRITIDFQKQEI